MVVYMAGSRVRGWAIGAALLLCAQAWAHHSFASTYVPDKTVTVDGKVVEFLYRSPHSVVLVESGGVTWAGDWSSAGQLSRQGIDEDTLKPGDHVIATGNPSRNAADHRLRLQTLTRPSDGWKWSDVLQ
jgi:Family of unknown function (DUF6152)